MSGWPNGGDYGPVYPLSLGQLLPLPGLPGGLGGCDFGVCGGLPGLGFQAGEEVLVAPLAWEGIKDLVAAGLGLWALWQQHQARRLQTVTCKCQIGDLTEGFNMVGYAVGVGVGPTVESAKNAAYANATQNAKRETRAQFRFPAQALQVL